MYLAHLVERKTDNFDVIGSIPIVYFFSPCQFSLNFNLGSCQNGLCMGLQNLLREFDSPTTLNHYLGCWQMWSLHLTENQEDPDRNGDSPHKLTLNKKLYFE